MAWTALKPPARAAQRPPGEDRGAPTSCSDIDVENLTVSELAIAADVRRVDPSSLLSGPAQAKMREDLELVAQLSDSVAALTVSVARLDPATAGVLAGMIERCAAADRRRRPPTP